MNMNLITHFTIQSVDIYRVLSVIIGGFLLTSLCLRSFNRTK